MATKRMFSMKIVDTDAFLDMPMSTQCLYFHLNMRADDDGFIGNPKRIQKLIGANDDDLKLLIAKRFVLTFDSGVIVIKHWRIHNTLRNDRYVETTYIEEKNMLSVKENKAYTDKKVDVSKMVPNCFQNGTTDIGLDKVLVLEEDKEKDKKETFSAVINGYTLNDLLKNALKDYVDMRNKMKGFTVRALKLNLNKLDDLSSDDSIKIKIVNQSVMNSWKSFYELKNNREEKQEKQEFNITKFDV